MTGLAFSILADDLSIDEEGNVTITNPQVAQTVAAASKASTPAVGGGAVTNNCNGGNCAAGCGVKQK